MTRPDPAACLAASPWYGIAAVFTACGWPRSTWWFTAAAISAGIATGMLLLFWNVPSESDLMAVADATRETCPDHVPAAWVKEFRG